MKTYTAKNSASITTIAYFLGLMLFAFHFSAAAQQTVITDDGREVLILDDGHWKFSSTDRFANTNDGHRILLKDDGRWHFVKNTTLNTNAAKKESTLDIQIEKVVIEKHTKKGFKNNRVKTQTVFYLQLRQASNTETDVIIKDSDLTLIKVKDNNGETYPVLSIEPRTINFDTSKTASIIIRSKKSPSILDGAKSMSIVIKAGLFGLTEPISLKQRIFDFEELDVEGFN